MAWHANNKETREALMLTRNVVLTDHQAHFVEQLVAAGRYQNASELLHEGLRFVELSFPWEE